MAVAIFPRKWNTKPSGPVTIDLGHPLARGLFHFIPLTEGGGGEIKDIITGDNLDQTYSTSLHAHWANSPEGRGFSHDQQILTGTILNPTVSGKVDISFVSWFYLNDIATVPETANLGIGRWNSTDTFILSRLEAGRTQIRFSGVSTGESYVVYYTHSFKNKRRNCLVWRKDGSGLTCWINGKSVTVDSGGGSGNFSAITGLEIFHGDGSHYSFGGSGNVGLMAAIYDTYLSADRIAWLSEEPYSIFVPQRNIKYFYIKNPTGEKKLHGYSKIERCGKTQPTGQVEIDYGHPLGHGLIFASIPGIGLTDLVTRRVLAFSNRSYSVLGDHRKIGKVLLNTSGDAAPANITGIERFRSIKRCFSIAGSAVLDPLAYNYRSIMRVDTGVNSSGIGFGRFNSAGSDQFIVYYKVTTTYGDTAYSENNMMPGDNVAKVFLGVRNNDNGIFYVNGRKVTTLVDFASPQDVNWGEGGSDNMVQLNDLQGCWGWIYAWNRALVSDQAAWLNEEPYSFLIKRRKVSYFFLPQVTTYTKTGYSKIERYGSIKPTGAVEVDKGHSLAPDLGYWPLNEGAGGKVIELVRGGSGDTLPATRSRTIRGTSLLFPSGSNGITGPTIQNTIPARPHTFHALIRPSSLAETYNWILGYGETSGNIGVSLVLATEHIGYFFNGGAYVLLSTGHLTADHFYFVTAVCKGVTALNYPIIKFYINGIFDSEITATQGANTTISSAPWYIGRWTDTSWTFHGDILFISAYNRALSDGEISRLVKEPYSFLIKKRNTKYFFIGQLTSGTYQRRFRFRDDDGTEDTASWLADLNTNITRGKDINTRIRLGLETVGDAAAEQYQLEYKKTTDETWKKVT